MYQRLKPLKLTKSALHSRYVIAIVPELCMTNFLSTFRKTFFSREARVVWSLAFNSPQPER